MMDFVAQPAATVVALERLEICYAGGFSAGPLTWEVGPGERLGLAGESGCGKTTVLEHLAGLPRPGTTTFGRLRVCGRIGYVPQEALDNLSPFLSVVEQVAHVAGSAAGGRAWMEKVGLGASRHAQARPHQLSGGERQRVLIAQALATSPAVILADEPAAQLDDETQESILALLDQVVSATGAALVVASHQESVFERLRCRLHRMTPAPPPAPPRRTPLPPEAKPAVRVAGLSKSFSHRGLLLSPRHVHRALDGVSLEIGRGETVALRGASGSGKSTLARCLAGRERWDAGAVEFAGVRRAQLVAQEPSGSLSPRVSVGEALREASSEAGAALLEEMNLPATLCDRPVSALSEGQRTRVAIARAMAAAGGGLLILDESLSSLDDGNAQAIARAVAERQRRLGLACLLITHDRRLAGWMAHRELRMAAGRIGP